MIEFKVGDRVTIKSVGNYEPLRGVIVNIKPNSTFPYYVKWDNLYEVPYKYDDIIIDICYYRKKKIESILQ